MNFNCLLFSLLTLVFIGCSSNAEVQLIHSSAAHSSSSAGFDSSRITVELPRQLKVIRNFILANPGKYSEETAILIDMRIPSRYNRFFVVDLKSGDISARGLVAHGSGSETEIADSLKFSNLPGSYMTSLGTYRIGASYTGSFGKSYKLHGLEKSNSKAFERLVVFHRYSCIPGNGEQPFNICNSLGCPMVSEAFFPVVEKYIEAAANPVLMRIYY